MTQRIIDIGVQGNDGTGDSIRTSFDKVNKNFAELYAVFGVGGTIKFTDLGDAPSSYTANQVFMASKTGVGITARDLVQGAGIIIDKTNDSAVTISAAIAGIINDNVPTLSQPLNAADHAIGNLIDPSAESLAAFNAKYGSTPTTLEKMAISKGYADAHYVAATPTFASNGTITGYTLSAPYKPRAQPILPETTSPDYDPTLTGNYLATEVMQRRDTVYRGGDTMTGELTLSDHPSPFEGFGTPNTASDLQAATKFYVDQNTYYSGVNLYVSATKGDDLQQNTPAGREGRAWQYAYKSVAAAAAAAENLQLLAETEPGPYKQNITWSTTTTQYPSVVQSVQMSGGNSGITGYQDAVALIQANKAFIQAETIAYLNKKYVNSFTLNKARYSSIIGKIINGIGYDLVLGSNYNSLTETYKLFNSYNSDIITNQLTQIIDGINYARNEILSYGFNTTNLDTYVDTLIKALAYDVVFGSNYQSIQAALEYSAASTTVEIDEIVDLLDYSTIAITGASGSSTTVTLTFDEETSAPFVVGGSIIVSGMSPVGYNGVYTVTACTTSTVSYENPTTTAPVTLGTIGKNNLISAILNIPAVASSPSAVNNLKSNASAISLYVQTGELPVPSFDATGSSIPGQTSAVTLLMENIKFIQAEIAGWIRVHYPALSYDTKKSARDVEYIVWAIIYDLMYGGNSQSIRLGSKYWLNDSSVLAATEKTACANAISYINTVAQAVVTNTPPATSYQQSITQYINSTLAGNNTATATVVSGATNSYTLTVATGSVPISVGQVITGSGFTAQQTVVAATVSGSNTIITLSAYPNTNPTVGATLTFTSPVLGSIAANVATLNSMVAASSTPSPTIVYPTTTVSSSALQSARSAMIAPSKLATLKTTSDNYLQNSKFAIITNSTITSTINNLFDGVVNLLSTGSSALLAVGTITGGTTSSPIINVTISSGTVYVGQRLYGTGFGTHTVTAVTVSGNSNTITLSANPSAIPSGTVYFMMVPTIPTVNAGTPNIAAAEALKANINFIARESTNYISSTFPSLTFDTASSIRDISFLIQAVVYDLTYGGNSAVVNAASQFWLNGISQVPNKYAVNQACNSGIAWAESISLLVSKNDPVTTLYSAIPQVRNTAWVPGVDVAGAIGTLFDTILDILANNNADTYTVTYPTLTSYDSEYTAARSIIASNVTTVTNDVNTYLGTKYTGNFKYNQTTCYRDLGYIIDGAVIDLLSGGNYQSINAGKAYYRNASSKSVAIGTQYTETLDGIQFARDLIIQVLKQTYKTRFQSTLTQYTTSTRTASVAAINTFTSNYKYILDIIQYGYGVAPTPSFGSGVYTVTISNGGIGFVDQGRAGSVHIIPAKVLVGTTSNAYGQIVSYTQGGASNVDTIVLKMTRPGFYTCFTTTATGTAGAYSITVSSATNISVGLGVTGTGVGLGAVVTAINGTTITLSVPNSSTVNGSVTFGEQLQFGETVNNLQITLMIESGIYYEDFPIRLPTNVSVKGDDFRRVIIRPIDRVSQSPWASIFFYRDGIIDGMQQNPINYTGTDYATPVSLTLNAKTGTIQGTLSSGQVPQSWIGLVLTDNTSDNATVGKAIITSVSGSLFTATTVYPFNSLTFTSGNWHIYSTINYGRHYLSNPLDYTSAPLNNKNIDVFLMNDATHVSYVSFQGHGGFAVVLDPAGQIKTKSPFVRDSASFSGSTTTKRFAGGMFVDGFAGRVYGTIQQVGVTGINNQSQIVVVGSPNSGLDVRAPQVPSAFFIQGNRYQIDDVSSFDASTYTAVLTLDVSTPLSFSGAYSTPTMTTNMGNVIDALAYDAALGSNYKSVAMGLFYLQSRNEVAGLAQALVSQGIKYIGTSANSLSISAPSLTSINANVTSASSIVLNGAGSVPTLVMTAPVGATTGQVGAKNILQDATNRKFIQQEITSWVADKYSLSSINGYNALTMQRDVGYMVDAISYDLLYGNNSATYDLATSFWNSGSTTLTTAGTYTYGTKDIYYAAMTRLDEILEQIVQNTTVTKSSGNYASQNQSITPSAGSTEASRIATLTGILGSYINTGTFGSTTRLNPSVSGQSSTQIADFNLLASTNKSSILTNLLTYLNNGAGISINIEMAGNRSMLGDNFTQVNDMGYGIVATNGGVSEQVSTFTYYCYTSQWAINGGQIRSVSGSSAHGVYGLRASSYNPTELPDSITMVNDMVQTARIYKQATTAGYMLAYPPSQAFTVWIVGYEYIPTINSELEIDHTLAGGAITRYSISQVQKTTIVVGGQNVLQLTLGTTGLGATVSTGLAYNLYDGQVVTIRILSDILFKNVNTATISSTTAALQYAPTLADIYQITSFNSTYSTGEALPSNYSILENNSVFNYYALTVDNTKISTVDTADVTKTQGSKVGDFKVAVIPAGSDAIISQINTGTWQTAWNGRVHRVASYTKEQYSGAGSVVTQTPTLTGVSSTGNVVTLSSNSGLIVNAPIVFTAQTQTPTLLYTSASGNLLTLSSATGLVVGETIVFSNVSPLSGVVTQTFASTDGSRPNQLVLATPTTLIAGMVINLSGTNFGSLTNGNFFIKQVIDSTHITITSTYDGTVYPITSGGTGAMAYQAGQTMGGISTGTTYYITSVNSGANQITVSTTYGGGPVSVSQSAGSWTSVAGNTFGNIVSGTTYYIASVTNSTNITISSTVGGATFAVGNGNGTWTSVAGVSTGGITMVINNPSGVIANGQTISGTGFSSGQTVAADPSVSGSYTLITLSAAPNSTPSGTITFGTSTNAYVTLDPNPVFNSSAAGTGVNAFAYVTSVVGPTLLSTSNVVEYAIFNVPTAYMTGTSATVASMALPVVDSLLTVSGTTNTSYNGSPQVYAVQNQATVNVATTTGLNVGMTLSAGYLSTATATTNSTASFTATITGTTTLTVTSGTNPTIGMIVSGTGIPTGTYLTAGSGTGPWTLSAACTNGTGIAVTGTGNFITVTSANGMSAGTAISITLSYNNGLSTGAAFGNLTPSNYYITTVNGNSITVSATQGGTPITLTTATGNLGTLVYYTNANTVIPASCIVQTITDTSNFIVSPAAWLPVGTPLIATVPTTVASVTVISGGTGFNQGNPPTVTFSGGGNSNSVVQAIASATVNQYGVITKITIISPGQGYTSTPTITLGGSGNVGSGAMLAVVMSSSATYTSTVVSSTPSTAVTLAYATAPGLSSTTVSTNNSTVNFVANITTNTTLTYVSGLTPTTGSSLTASGIPTGTTISGASSPWTLSQSSTNASSLAIVANSPTSSVTGAITTGTTATFTGTITGTTLTVSGVSGTIAVNMVLSGGTVLPGTYIVSGSGTTWTVNQGQMSTCTTGTPVTLTITAVATGALIAGSVITGGSILAGSYAFAQLTATNSAAATTTATGTINTKSIVVASITGVAVGQFVVATGIPANTYVSTISGTTVTLSNALTAGLSSTAINFYTAGLTGTYAVNKLQTQTSTTVTGTTNLITVNSTTGLSVGQPITFNGTSFGGIAPISAATGTFTNGSVSTNILVVSSVTGTIAIGQVVSGTGFNGTQVVIAVTQTSTGATVTLNVPPSATPSGIVTFSSFTYYVNSVVATTSGPAITISATSGGSNLAVTPATGSLSFYSPNFVVNYTTAVTGSPTKSGSSSPYSVTYTVSSSITIINGAYYQITGHSNPLFNGIWATTSSSGSGTTLILKYPYDPGTVTTTSTIYVAATANNVGTSSQLGISKPFDTYTQDTLRLGFSAGTYGQVTTKISTSRATSHDFLNIGTGGYNTSNYPSVIYGEPSLKPTFTQQTLEETVGRVFFVSTDQDGLFRVGKFFTINQGTGNVTLGQSISLNNLNGLGFKNGITVTSFSNDSTFSNANSTTVPTQLAISNFIDYRLGLTSGGSQVPSSNILGPGFLPLNGALAMAGNLNMNGSNIINLVMPLVSSSTDVANKGYVDQQVALFDQLSELRDVTITSAANGNHLIYDTASSKWKNIGLPTGDVNTSYSGSALTTTIQANKIYNSMVNSVANIAQSKLWMNWAVATGAATTTTVAAGNFVVGKAYTILVPGTTDFTLIGASSNTVGVTFQATGVGAGTGTAYDNTAIQATLGLASFDSTMFTATNGFVTLKDSTSTSTGIVLNKLQQIATGTLLGNRSGNTANVTTITPANVITDGGGIFQSNFGSGSGVLIQTAQGSGYSTLGYSSTAQSSPNASKLVQAGSDGAVDVASLKVSGYSIVTVSGTTTQWANPGAAAGLYFMTSIGATAGATTTTTYGTWDFTNGTLKVGGATTGNITTGATNNAVNFTGIFKPTTSSSIDMATNSAPLYVNSINAGPTSSSTGIISGQWTLSGSSTLQATYADLAEFYEGDQEYEPGTVLVFGGEKEVTTTTTINDTRSAGVVTTNPAYVMNAEQTGIKVCIALAGRVPVKVVGRVKKGDMLTTSATPGYAVKAINPTLGSIIGKALEDKDYGEAGVIQVAIGRV